MVYLSPYPPSPHHPPRVGVGVHLEHDLAGGVARDAAVDHFDVAELQRGQLLKGLGREVEVVWGTRSRAQKGAEEDFNSRSKRVRSVDGDSIEL